MTRIVDRCNNCNGLKNVLGMGGMKIECVICSGKGFLVTDNQEDKTVEKAQRRGKRKNEDGIQS